MTAVAKTRKTPKTPKPAKVAKQAKAIGSTQSLSAFVKGRVKEAVKYIGNYEEAVARAGEALGVIREGREGGEAPEQAGAEEWPG